MGENSLLPTQVGVIGEFLAFFSPPICASELVLSGVWWANTELALSLVPGRWRFNWVACGVLTTGAEYAVSSGKAVFGSVEGDVLGTGAASFILLK